MMVKENKAKNKPISIHLIPIICRFWVGKNVSSEESRKMQRQKKKDQV